MSAAAASRTFAALSLGLALSGGGCERGCARSWLGEHGVGNGRREPSGSAPLGAIDCADGLARCSGGVVEASRRTTLPWPCHGTPEQCACPWERLADCEGGCVADGVEVVVPGDRAVGQLCVAGADAGRVAVPAPGGEAPRGCDEGQAYRCEGGVVTACLENAVVGRCLHGCVAESSGLDDDVPVSREAAAAILCSR